MGQTGRMGRFLAGLALAGAMSFVPVLAQEAPVPPPAAAPVIDGWGPLKFGMSIADAKAASDISWSPRNCTDQQEIALKGCVLGPDFGIQYGDGKKGSRYEDDFYKIAIDGMRFQPRLTFDRWGRLERIELQFREDVDGIGACQPYFQRTMDNLERRYGRFATPADTLTPFNRQNGWTSRKHATSAGTPYFLDVNTGTQAYFSSIMASDPTARDEAAELAKQNILRKTARAYIHLRMSLTNGSSPDSTTRCSIDIFYEAAHMPAPQPTGSNKIDF